MGRRRGLYGIWGEGWKKCDLGVDFGWMRARMIIPEKM